MSEDETKKIEGVEEFVAPTHNEIPEEQVETLSEGSKNANMNDEPKRKEEKDKLNKSPIEEENRLERLQRLQERLEKAKRYGERVIEVTVNPSFTIRVPESFVFTKCINHQPPGGEGEGSWDFGVAVMDQNNDVYDYYDLEKFVLEKIKEQYPEFVEVSETRTQIINELREMTTWNGEETEKTETFNPERARELVRQLREMDRKYHSIASSGELSETSYLFERLGSKID